MFNCVDCGYIAKVFNGKVAGIDKGSFTYKAICPKCGSEKVNVLPGTKEKAIRIEA